MERYLMALYFSCLVYMATHCILVSWVLLVRSGGQFHHVSLIVKMISFEHLNKHIVY